MAEKNRSNFPTAMLSKMPEGSNTEAINSLMILKQGCRKIKSDNAEALKERIQEIIELCKENDIRLGIETLCAGLNISRMQFWRYCKGEQCSKEFSEVCQDARQMIIALLEIYNMNGKLNPASSIFYLKNWANYRDEVSIDTSNTNNQNTLSIDDLPLLQEITNKSTLSVESLPDIKNTDSE